jgi:hypothetical protein
MVMAAASVASRKAARCGFRRNPVLHPAWRHITCRDGKSLILACALAEVAEDGEAWRRGPHGKHWQRGSHGEEKKNNQRDERHRQTENIQKRQVTENIEKYGKREML